MYKAGGMPSPRRISTCPSRGSAVGSWIGDPRSSGHVQHCKMQDGPSMSPARVDCSRVGMVHYPVLVTVSRSRACLGTRAVINDRPDAGRGDPMAPPGWIAIDPRQYWPLPGSVTSHGMPRWAGIVKASRARDLGSIDGSWQHDPCTRTIAGTCHQGGG